MRAGAIAVAGAAFLLACTKPPSAWTRIDGLPIASERLQADTLGCKGQVERAAIAGQARSTVDMPAGMDNQDYRAFIGCMADRGYLPGTNRP